MSAWKRFRHDGFELVRLSSERASVTVVPELGGRIVSLCDLKGGREWLWNPGAELRLWKNRLDDPFDKGTFAGADECIPTIRACEWQGRSLPDHGEAWTQEWVPDGAADDCLRLSVSLPRSPLDLVREIRICGDTLRMDYTIGNRGEVPEAWLWAWHPLLRIDPDDRLSLPAEVKDLRVEVATHAGVERGILWPWPESSPDIRLDKLDLGGPNSFMKAFAGPLHGGCARLANSRTCDWLELTWDTGTLPFLGLWLTRGGFNGWHHLALEPTNLPADSLADACCENPSCEIEPGGRRRWWLEIRLGRTASPADHRGGPREMLLGKT